MLASLTARAHRSVSAWIKAENSCGLFGDTSIVFSVSRVFISVRLSALTRVACSLATIDLGTAARVHTPYQTVTSEPGNQIPRWWGRRDAADRVASSCSGITEVLSGFAQRARAAWARLIRTVYEAGPLECPKVQEGRCASSR